MRPEDLIWEGKSLKFNESSENKKDVCGGILTLRQKYFLNVNEHAVNDISANCSLTRHVFESARVCPYTWVVCK